MLDIPCPQLERFAIELIDAYRLRDDLINKFPASQEAIEAGIEVFRVHGVITAHLAQCVICQNRTHAMEEKRLFSAIRNDSAISHVG